MSRAEDVLRTVPIADDPILVRVGASGPLAASACNRPCGEAVCAGNRYRSRRNSHVLLEAMDAPLPAPAAAPTGSTARQLEVLRCISRGLANQQIARQLPVSPKTVALHRGLPLQRLELHDVGSLTRCALQAGLA